VTPIETATRLLIGLLVRGDMDTAAKITRGRRLDAEALKRAVADYGRTLVPPGAGWWDLVDVTPIRDSAPQAYHVAAPLWSIEEGRSDLTLELRLTEVAPEAYDSEILDLHVL
jgi:hypothetical protein